MNNKRKMKKKNKVMSNGHQRDENRNITLKRDHFMP
jgi:hypothetical protein